MFEELHDGGLGGHGSRVRGAEQEGMGGVRVPEPSGDGTLNWSQRRRKERDPAAITEGRI